MRDVMIKFNQNFECDNTKLSSTAQPDSTSQMAPWCFEGVKNFAAGICFLGETCAITAF